MPHEKHPVFLEKESNSSKHNFSSSFFRAILYFTGFGSTGLLPMWIRIRNTAFQRDCESTSGSALDQQYWNAWFQIRK